jgi:hypothetical protein
MGRLPCGSSSGAGRDERVADWWDRLFQDDRGGLQVRSPEGTFVDATPIEGTVVVNAGDLLARWSNDTIKSTIHRVVEPPTKSNKYPARYSIAYVHHVASLSTKHARLWRLTALESKSNARQVLLQPQLQEPYRGHPGDIYDRHREEVRWHQQWGLPGAAVGGYLLTCFGVVSMWSQLRRR